MQQNLAASICGRNSRISSGPGVNEAKTGMGKAGVAAELALRRLLQHHDALGAGLPGGDSSFERRAAAAHDNNINFFALHG